MHYKFGGTVILLLAGLLVLTIIFGSWYTIDQTQRGVLLRTREKIEALEAQVAALEAMSVHSQL